MIFHFHSFLHHARPQPLMPPGKQIIRPRLPRRPSRRRYIPQHDHGVDRPVAICLVARLSAYPPCCFRLRPRPVVARYPTRAMTAPNLLLEHIPEPSTRHGRRDPEGGIAKVRCAGSSRWAWRRWVIGLIQFTACPSLPSHPSTTEDDKGRSSHLAFAHLQCTILGS